MTIARPRLCPIRGTNYSCAVAWRAESDARLDIAPDDMGSGSGASSAVPQISVVLCTFNRADQVGEAVAAILDQHGADLELLVVDDGSTDDTPTVLAAIDDDRLRVVRRPNGGLSFARNSGLAAATAPWVVFIDDDDTAQPGWAAAFVTLGADPTVGIACVGAQYVKADGTPLFAKPPARLESPYLDLEAVLAVAHHGAAMGCDEALFTLGEAPEARYPDAAQWLAGRGPGQYRMADLLG